MQGAGIRKEKPVKLPTTKLLSLANLPMLVGKKKNYSTYAVFSVYLSVCPLMFTLYEKLAV